MCFLRWSLLAAWLAVHAALWMVLPPVPDLRLPGGDFAFLDDGKLIVANDGSALRVFDVASGRLMRAADPAPFAGFRDLAVASHGRRFVAYSSSGPDTAVGLLFDLDGEQTKPFPVRPGCLASGDLELTPDGKTVVYFTGSERDPRYRICIWNVETDGLRFVEIPDLLNGVLKRLYMSPAGDRVAFVGQSKDGDFVEMIDLPTARSLGRDVFTDYRWNETPIFVPGFSPDGRGFATLMDDFPSGHQVALWSTGGGWRRVPAPNPAFGLCWRDEGLIAWAFDGPSCLIDPATGATRDLPAAPFPIDEGFYFETSGLSIFSRYHPNLAYLHNLLGLRRGVESTNDWHIRDRTGREIAVLPYGGQPAITPDGSRFADVLAGHIVLYHLPPRYPHGFVLGLMIAEVAVAIVWATRRRLPRKRAA
jgi:hypothetical protein